MADLMKVVAAISGSKDKIVISQVYVSTMYGDLIGGLFLGELMFWSQKADDDGWFWMDNDKLEANGITKYAREKAVKILKSPATKKFPHGLEVIETKTKKVGKTPRLHYRIKSERMASVLSMNIFTDTNPPIHNPDSDLGATEDTPPDFTKSESRDSDFTKSESPRTLRNQEDGLYEIGESYILTTNDLTTNNITTESNQSSSETRVEEEPNESFDDDDWKWNDPISELILENFKTNHVILRTKREQLDAMVAQWRDSIGSTHIEEIIDRIDDPLRINNPLAYIGDSVASEKQKRANREVGRRGWPDQRKGQKRHIEADQRGEYASQIASDPDWGDIVIGVH